MVRVSARVTMFMVVMIVMMTVLVAVLVGAMAARRRTEMIRRIARVQRCVHRHSFRTGARAARTATGGGGQSARRGLGLDLNGERGDADALRWVAEQRRDRVQNALRIGRGEHCAKTEGEGDKMKSTVMNNEMWTCSVVNTTNRRKSLHLITTYLERESSPPRYRPNAAKTADCDIPPRRRA
jgi:hypothetical protein